MRQLSARFNVSNAGKLTTCSLHTELEMNGFRVHDSRISVKGNDKRKCRFTGLIAWLKRSLLFTDLPQIQKIQSFLFPSAQKLSLNDGVFKPMASNQNHFSGSAHIPAIQPPCHLFSHLPTRLKDPPNPQNPKARILHVVLGFVGTR